MLLQERYFGMVVVPNQGLFAFGGDLNNLTTSQKLQTIDAEWSSGPDLFNLKNDFGNCVIQVFNSDTFMITHYKYH